MKTTKAQNMRLIDKFPFLLPRNRWTDKIPEDYDFSYTELDAMPDGWRIAFGKQMCQEIKDDLIRIGYLDKYRISQIKEKYGILHWYDFGCSEKMLHEIIPKYEELSKRTCIRCGKPAVWVTTGWVSPYCDDCAPKDERKVTVKEFYDEE